MVYVKVKLNVTMDWPLQVIPNPFALTFLELELTDKAYFVWHQNIEVSQRCQTDGLNWSNGMATVYQREMTSERTDALLHDEARMAVVLKPARHFSIIWPEVGDGPANNAKRN